MLTGEFNHSIDSKGRLIIPSKLRDSLGEHFVITKGMDGCLFLYPENEWEAFEEKLRTLPLTNKKARDFKRFFLGSAVEGEIDKQGRVLLSTSLRTYADLEKEMLEKINALGIGPQGFGGQTTALGVNIETLPTHIAGLPCAVNINCHVTRHKSAVL